MEWNDLEKDLAYFLINDGRIKEASTDNLRFLLKFFKTKTGDKVPMLTKGMPAKETLLVFYESGCGSYESTMAQLRELYSELHAEEIHVISISRDTNHMNLRILPTLLYGMTNVVI